jgi:hypothetical protein
MNLAYIGYPLLNALWTMVVFFLWIMFIWLLVTVWTDIFRRDDIDGWAKALWTVFTLLVPFLGVFVYLIVQGRAMQERKLSDDRRAKEQMDSYIRSTAHNGAPSSAEQIAQAKRLMDRGAITPEEYATLKKKALAV